MVNLSVSDGVAHLELHRPEARNAINLEMVQAVTAHLDALTLRDDVRVLLLSGSGGKAFASGADIAELRERTHREALRGINARMFQRVEDFPRPTIAAIEGYALGGGLELALACDLRIASEGSKLGLPETTLGIFPAAGGTWRLPRLIGLGRAKDLVFTGRILDTAEALRLGLIERMAPAGQAVAQGRAWALEIAANAPLALEVAKVALNSAARGMDVTVAERLGQGLLFDSPDKHARMTAFLEKKRK